VAPLREVVREKYRIPTKARAHVQGPDGPPGQVADQRRPNGVAVSEEIMLAAPPLLAGMLRALPVVDHDCQLISLVKRET
jgi:hypothetical protein